MIIPSHAELNAALGQPAFIHPLEIPLLCKYAAESRDLLEIGAAWGASAVLMLINMPDNACLTSIDAFVTDSMGTWQASEGACRIAVHRALHDFGRVERYEDWTLVPMTSADAYIMVDIVGGIDLLYIDGSHLPNDVDNDFLMWSPHLVHGGDALIHDSRQVEGAPPDVFAQGYAGPTALANRLRKHHAWTCVDEAFSLTVWKKN